MSARQRGVLYDLLPWASRWIALRLVAITPPPRDRRDLSRGRRRSRVREWAALSRILTGQLALYEIKGARISPGVALGFVDQALEDCDVAGRLLRERRYFRPVRLEAYLEEARGYRRLDLADAATAGSSARAEHQRLATTAFRRAADRLAEVDELLAGHDGLPRPARRAHAVRLTKTRLLAGDGVTALEGLPVPLDDQACAAAGFEDLYNEACLWAVAVRAVGAAEAAQARRARQQCGRLLARAAAKTGAKRARLIEHAKGDADFRWTFTAAEIDELVTDAETSSVG